MDYYINWGLCNLPTFKLPGQSPGRSPGRSRQKLKRNVKLVYNFLRFPVENLGFNEYRSRTWAVAYIFQTQFKKILKIQWGEFERPLWVRRWAYLKLRQEWIAG